MRKELLKRISDVCWEIPIDRKRGMGVPARIFTTGPMFGTIDDSALEQLANAATLPGVVKNTVAMPDIHSGYGLPIGGVMATDANGGVVSPGAAGYDINCGVRLLATPLDFRKIEKMRVHLADIMKVAIPGGIGRGGPLELDDDEYRQVAEKGALWAVENGYGYPEDISHCESAGRIEGGSLEYVSSRALKRGRNEVGTLGAGNHFFEIQYIDEVYEPAVAAQWGLAKEMVAIMIHTGSRGFGHQVATDHLEIMERAMKKYGIKVPDRELACAPVESREGREYLSAMNAAANYAWTNRQLLTHYARMALAEIFNIEPEEVRLIYDVCHNIIKPEVHLVHGSKKRVMVHRKGATRALPAGSQELPAVYQQTGQPVLVPGDMGRMSYLLAGSPNSMNESFGSTCHGAGRRLSRHQALKQAASSEKIQAELSLKGIEVRAAGTKTLAEEMPQAYKDVSEVVKVVEMAGLAVPVARMRPIVVIKG